GRRAAGVRRTAEDGAELGPRGQGGNDHPAGWVDCAFGSVALVADPLSTVLESLRLKGAVFLTARFTEPWAVITSVPGEFWRRLLSPSTELIAYHFVLEGSLLVALEGQPPRRAGAGEIVVLPRN